MLPCVLMERARDAVRLLDAHFFYVRAAIGLLFYARALHALFAFLLYSSCPLFVRFFLRYAFFFSCLPPWRLRPIHIR